MSIYPPKQAEALLRLIGRNNFTSYRVRNMDGGVVQVICLEGERPVERRVVLKSGIIKSEHLRA